VNEKYAFVDAECAAPAGDKACSPSVARVCEWLEISKSGYYDWRSRPKSATAKRRELLKIKVKALFDANNGTRMTHVPFKGGSPATAAVVSGEVDLAFTNMTDALPQMEANTVRALAVTSAKRSVLAPELPTMTETLPGFEVVGWYGLAAPAGTPKDLIAKLNGETNGVLQSPDLVAKMRELSYEPIGGTPEEANSRIKADVARWTKAIHDAGIEPQ